MGIRSRRDERLVGKGTVKVRRDPLQRVREEGVPMGEAWGWSNEARPPRSPDRSTSKDAISCRRIPMVMNLIMNGDMEQYHANPPKVPPSPYYPSAEL